MWASNRGLEGPDQDTKWQFLLHRTFYKVSLHLGVVLLGGLQERPKPVHEDEAQVLLDGLFGGSREGGRLLARRLKGCSNLSPPTPFLFGQSQDSMKGFGGKPKEK